MLLSLDTRHIQNSLNIPKDNMYVGGMFLIKNLFVVGMYPIVEIP